MEINHGENRIEKFQLKARKKKSNIETRTHSLMKQSKTEMQIFE
jgi:hypothetical protein